MNKSILKSYYICIFRGGRVPLSPNFKYTSVYTTTTRCHRVSQNTDSNDVPLKLYTVHY